MKNLVTTGLVSMAFSLSGCSSIAAKTNLYKGRIIEFKSGSDGFDTRTFFYEGESEVIAFDAQFTPELAEKSIQHLRTFTQKPISWLVITHPNPDKFNGASVFKNHGAKILASASTALAIPQVHVYKEYFFVEMAKLFKKGEYPQPAPVDQTFKNQMNLVLKGGETIQLHELAQPGVSNTQSVVYIESINSLIVGDLIHYKAHAWLEGGIVAGKATPTLTGWIEDLHELNQKFPATALVYGGRGQTIDLSTAVQAQISYLDRANLLIDRELTKMANPKIEFNGPEAGALYKKLAQIFEQEFPDYELSYMIEYGAYGLVQSKLN
jgi:glyoxylase-like metal-dependent hydrolase (beta-lactamase superfamily II)